MPVVMIWRNVSDSEPSPVYRAHCWLSPDIDALKAKRAQYARARDELLSLQKSTRDRDDARFLKEEANWLLKWYRAADHWTKWIAGEQDARPPSKWPIELARYFDHVLAEASN